MTGLPYDQDADCCAECGAPLTDSADLDFEGCADCNPCDECLTANGSGHFGPWCQWPDPSTLANEISDASALPFAYESTGGDCSALVAYVGAYAVVVTDERDAFPPDNTSTRVVVGLYVTAGPDDLSYWGEDGATDDRTVTFSGPTGRGVAVANAIMAMLGWQYRADAAERGEIRPGLGR